MYKNEYIVVLKQFCNNLNIFALKLTRVTTHWNGKPDLVIMFGVKYDFCTPLDFLGIKDLKKILKRMVFKKIGGLFKTLISVMPKKSSAKYHKPNQISHSDLRLGQKCFGGVFKQGSGHSAPILSGSPQFSHLLHADEFLVESMIL